MNIAIRSILALVAIIGAFFYFLVIRGDGDDES